MTSARDKILCATEKCYTFPEFFSKSTKVLKSITEQMPNHDDYLIEKEKVIAKSSSLIAAWLAPCYIEPLLTRAQEYHMFRKYNYYKWRSRKQLVEYGHLTRAKKILEKAIEVRNQIVNCNCRLAANVAAKVHGTTEDCYGEAYAGLVKAIDYFNPTINIKFSTYATWALQRSLWRVTKNDIRNDGVPLEDEERIEGRSLDYDQEIRYDYLKKTVRQLIKVTGKREAKIVRKRFGLNSKKLKDATFRDLAKEMGISRERVRQLEDRGLEEIRTSLERNPKLYYQLSDFISA